MNLKIENPPVTLRELCLNKVRNAIITGYFPSGKRLVERSLCEELGVEIARLKRIAIGPVKLGMLQTGKYRELNENEKNKLGIK